MLVPNLPVPLGAAFEDLSPLYYTWAGLLFGALVCLLLASITGFNIWESGFSFYGKKWFEKTDAGKHCLAFAGSYFVLFFLIIVPWSVLCNGYTAEKSPLTDSFLIAWIVLLLSVLTLLGASCAYDTRHPAWSAWPGPLHPKTISNFVLLVASAFFASLCAYGAMRMLDFEEAPLPRTDDAHAVRASLSLVITAAIFLVDFLICTCIITYQSFRSLRGRADSVVMQRFGLAEIQRGKLAPLKSYIQQQQQHILQLQAEEGVGSLQANQSQLRLLKVMYRTSFKPQGLSLLPCSMSHVFSRRRL